MVYSFRLEFAYTNNETKYVAVVHALSITIEIKLEDIKITSDSHLVIRQILGLYNTNEPSLQKYKQLIKYLSATTPNINWRHIYRKYNRFPDALAFISSMMVDPEAGYIKIETLLIPSINKDEIDVDVMIIESQEGDQEERKPVWRTTLHQYLQKAELPRNRLEAHKIMRKVTNYKLRDGVLYRRSFLGPSLRCLT